MSVFAKDWGFSFRKILQCLFAEAVHKARGKFAATDAWKKFIRLASHITSQNFLRYYLISLFTDPGQGKYYPFSQPQNPSIDVFEVDHNIRLPTDCRAPKLLGNIRLFFV